MTRATVMLCHFFLWGDDVEVLDVGLEAVGAEGVSGGDFEYWRCDFHQK